MKGSMSLLGIGLLLAGAFFLLSSANLLAFTGDLYGSMQGKAVLINESISASGNTVTVVLNGWGINSIPAGYPAYFGGDPIDVYVFVDPAAAVYSSVEAEALRPLAANVYRMQFDFAAINADPAWTCSPILTSPPTGGTEITCSLQKTILTKDLIDGPHKVLVRYAIRGSFIPGQYNTVFEDGLNLPVAQSADSGQNIIVQSSDMANLPGTTEVGNTQITQAPTLVSPLTQPLAQATGTTANTAGMVLGGVLAGVGLFLMRRG